MEPSKKKTKKLLSKISLKTNNPSPNHLLSGRQWRVLQIKGTIQGYKEE